MKNIVFTTLFSLLLLMGSQANAVTGARGTEEDKPLMVIRFNQPTVYYQLPLYRTIKKTLAIYPNAFFEIVAAVPTTGNFKQDQDGVEEAADYATLITDTLQEIGLPRSRFKTQYTSHSNSPDNEVRIYVR